MLDIKGKYRVPWWIDKGKYYPNMSYQETAEAVNGIGPASWPKWARAILDYLLSVFYFAMVIHDCDYERGMTKEDKASAETRFLKNCLLCVVFLLWWRPVKSLRFLIYAFALYLFVKKGGDDAFWKGKIKPS